jgi:hypothetical protein
MRFLFLMLLAVAGCGSDGNVADVDQGALPACPPGAAGLHGAPCRYGVDTQCLTEPDNYVAHCLCDGYWEVDQVLVLCNRDMARPGD